MRHENFQRPHDMADAEYEVAPRPIIGAVNGIMISVALWAVIAGVAFIVF